MALLFFLLLLNVAFLALASTNFTMATGWMTGSFQWTSFTYSYQNGWGYLYQSPYTLPVIVTYLLAYTAGAAAYAVTWAGGSRVLGLAGLVLSLAGLASFAIEGSHWVFVHNLSWIASFPAVMLLLAPLALVQAWRRRS
jgi:hypothetical protein